MEIPFETNQLLGILHDPRGLRRPEAPSEEPAEEAKRQGDPEGRATWAFEEGKIWYLLIYVLCWFAYIYIYIIFWLYLYYIKIYDICIDSIDWYVCGISGLSQCKSKWSKSHPSFTRLSVHISGRCWDIQYSFLEPRKILVETHTQRYIIYHIYI